MNKKSIILAALLLAAIGIGFITMIDAPTQVKRLTYVDVRTYGATGLGSVDEYASVHAAAVASIAAKATLRFPAGTYCMKTAFTDPVFGMEGDGVQQSIISTCGSTNALVNITSAPDGFKMQGLQFDGPGQSASGGQIGVTVANSGGNVSDAIFEDLYFSGWPNYALDLEAPIVTTVRNVRVLQSKRCLYYNGGTSVTTIGSYCNQITLAGFDINHTDYSSWISNACDTCGTAFLVRQNSQGLAFVGNGHEAGTARNVTVTNVALATNVATVTYTGDDLSVDWVSGLTVVIAGTSSTAGLFNGRVEPSSVTSSTIVYALTHADVVSAADSGTASLFPGDGIVINNSKGTQISGFYGLSAQQITSNHVTLSGTTANAMMFGVVSEVGGSGTPVTQTRDIYIGANTSNNFRVNANLVGGITNLGNQTQTISTSNLWTIGDIAHNTGTTASTGFIRLNKTDAINFRNNANSADVNGVTFDTSDIVQVGGSAGIRLGSSSGPRILNGTGSPESSVTAGIGSIYLRTDGGAGTSMYVKESGAGNTGWVGK